MCKTTEIWKPIISYDGLYEASTYGRVKSFIGRYGIKERILKLTKDKNGYLHVLLFKNKSRKYFSVHRLILETFMGSCPLGMECRHLDGNPSNNRLDNLKWGTKIENRADRKLHGTEYNGNQKGINNPMSKINDWIVRIIRQLLKEGKLYQREIAKIFGLDQSSISYIKNRKIWKHIK
jgi:hypothetical protein